MNISEAYKAIIEQESITNIPIKSILRSEDGVANAGKSGTTNIKNEPVQVTKLPNGDTYLLDGYHRIHSAINNGDTHINAKYNDFNKVKILFDNERRFLRHGQSVGCNNAETHETLGISK